MSLLMKALEKAAKDRGEYDMERTAAAPASGAGAAGAGTPASGLTLEPIAPQHGAMPGAAAEPTPSPRRHASAAPVAPEASSTQFAQAATLIRAGQREGGGGISAYVRNHPVVVFGTVATLFLAGYGAYVYLQMTNPGMFVRQQPARPTQAVPAPLTPPASGVIEPGAATAQALTPPVAPTSLLPPLQAGAEREKPTIASGAAAAAATRSAVPPAPAAPAPQAPRDSIKVTAGGATPTVNPLLAGAFQALNAGNLELSQRLYDQLLSREPNNIDALLGLAAIAGQKSDSAQATKYYLRLLELEPQNALAQAGMIGMLGRADPLAAESRLKQLIAREPSAYLYFTLGNIYADQDRWPDAQQAYFQAYHLQPGNPDYAYNLAVGLEHVGQPRLALDYYRGALQLATTGRANFSTAAAQERVSKLEKIAQ